MDFSQLCASPFTPFYDFVSVERAKLVGFIPEAYHDVFVNRCICGSERIARLSDGSVTGIMCCDPHCRIKLTYQLALIFERFGYKGIGKETCSKVVGEFYTRGKQFGVSDVLLAGEGIIDLGGATEDKWFEGIATVKQSKQTFGTFIYRLSFPGIGSKFEDVMQGISSISELTEIIKKEGFLNFFANRGIKSLTTLYYFLEYLPEIDKLSTALSECITTSAEKVIPVCMTGRMLSVLGKKTKSDFLAACSAYLEKRGLASSIQFKPTDSVSKAGFLIAGEDAVAGMTGKYRLGLEKQRMKGERFVFSPDEFLYLVAGGGEENE